MQILPGDDWEEVFNAPQRRLPQKLHDEIYGEGTYFEMYGEDESLEENRSS